jgi:CheY-like chemotaxis protein
VSDAVISINNGGLVTYLNPSAERQYDRTAERALGPAARRPLHVSTGWGQDEDRRRTQAAGFDAHLVKPVAPDALLALIEQAPRPTP